MFEPKIVRLKLDTDVAVAATATTATACKINELCRKSVFLCWRYMDNDNDGYIGSSYRVGGKMDGKQKQ